MIAIFLKLLPFFALIGLGYWAARARFFPPDAVAALTKFIFWFALSAMLFHFAAALSLEAIFDPLFVAVYLSATLLLYALALAVGLSRRVGLAEAAMEAQVATNGNTGFMGVPLLVAVLGPLAAGPVLMVLVVDLIVLGSLATILITLAREGRITARLPLVLAKGVATNPMIVSLALGLAWSASGLPLWQPLDDFTTILGAAATPGALFAIGASLSGKSAERWQVAGWLSFAKLVLHPALVTAAALITGLAWPAAGVMIAAASLPVAGNVYMLAQHYGVAPQRVSTSILISTVISIATVTAVIAMVGS